MAYIVPPCPPVPLPDAYRAWIDRCIDEDGVSIPHGLVIHHDGTMTVLALALPIVQAYPLMLARWAKGAREMIFAFDRFTKPGQGTTLGDLVAGHYFTGAERRPFIIEYQHAPRIVKPIDWNNAFWNAALDRELVSHLRAIAAGTGKAPR